MDEYDGSRESWDAHVKDMLAALRCSEQLRAKLRDAAIAVRRLEWGMARQSGMDRAFLAYLASPDEPWLSGELSVDHYLPPSVMNAARGKGDLDARDSRVAHAIEALRDWGWAPEEAVNFVASKEEWAEVLRRSRSAARPARDPEAAGVPW